jgi:hypothetical protein
LYRQWGDAVSADCAFFDASFSLVLNMRGKYAPGTSGQCACTTLEQQQTV